eukprot:6175660-Pleurochrysis_carterae.AAC.2
MQSPRKQGPAVAHVAHALACTRQTHGSATHVGNGCSKASRHDPQLIHSGVFFPIATPTIHPSPTY